MCKSVFCQLWNTHCGLYRLLFPDSLCAQWKIRWKSLLIGENVKSGWGQSKVLACCRWILLFSPLGHCWCNYRKPEVMTIKNPSVLIQKPKQIFLLAALASRLLVFSHCFFKAGITLTVYFCYSNSDTRSTESCKCFTGDVQESLFSPHSSMLKV